MIINSENLKKFLTDAKLITKEQFDLALKKSHESGKSVADTLVAEGLIDEERIASAKAYISGVPFINIENETIAPEVLKIIPEPIARVHNIIAFRKEKNRLQVAMIDPEDIRTIDFLHKTNPALEIIPRLTTASGIKSALAQYQQTLEIEFGDIIKEEIKDIKHIKDDGENFQGKEILEKAAAELPVVKVVDTLLKHAILQKASDVHIEPLEKEVIVRYRVDGILRVVMTLPASVASGIVARIKVLSSLKLDEHRLPQDGRFKIETDEFKYSIRVSVLPVYNGEKIVMRLLAEDVKASTLDGLGFYGNALEIIKNSLQKSTGMILITGPTGSGKTTTLYTMMEMLNTPDVNISTVEDPIEYRMPRINQTQVNAKIGFTFASGLRVLLRQDPDIIMVGEIRDDETAALAINAALTGHLVLSTLHTTEAAGAIPRLIDMKAEPFLIASTLNVIIAQRLVRKIYESKEPYKLTKAELKNLSNYANLERILEILKQEGLAKEKDTLEDITFYHAKPTKDSPDGYKGRIGIYEVLAVTEKIKELIIKKSSTNEIAQEAKKNGMKTMVEDGFVKAAKGITSIEEILRVITE